MTDKPIKSERVSYLSTLKFDPNLRNRWWAKYITNFRFVLLLIVSIIAIGTFSYFAIPRRLNPEIKIPIVIVTTILPGSSPNDIESLVTVPLEDKLKNLKGLDTITSVSRENVSNITLQFVTGTNPDQAKSDAQSAVDSAKLPTDAQTPSVIAIDFENQPVWNFAIVTNEDVGSLNRFAKVLKSKIEASRKVDRVTTSGLDTQEIQVIVNQPKLQDYNLNSFTLAQAISKATNSYPAGTIETKSSNFSLSIDRDIYSLEDIRAIRITVAGQVIRLGDVATVAERPKLLEANTYYASSSAQPQRTAQFFVYRAKTANIDATETEVKKILNETITQYDNRFQVINVLNAAEEIANQFGELVSEFRSTIILVFINLLLFLGLRQALISSLTVPLTFLSAIAIMNILGQTLNFLTLFAFLIALGLLIDDTIVTVAAMTRYSAIKRFTPDEAGMLVWRDFIVPLWSTTITTIWAFVPLLIASGIIGEFIKPIPIVVTSTMLSSTSIAVLITLPLMIVTLKSRFPLRVQILLRTVIAVLLIGIGVLLLPKNPLFPLAISVYILLLSVLVLTRSTLLSRYDGFKKKHKMLASIEKRTLYIINNGLINLEVVSRKYMSIIARLLNSRSARIKTLLAIVIFAVVAYLLVPLGLVKSEFFPKTDADLIYISVDMPTGANLQRTNGEAVRLLNELRHTPGILFVIADVNAGMDTMGARSNTTGSILYTLHLVDKKERKLTSVQIAEYLRKRYQGYVAGTLAVREQSGGPPAGADLQIKILGDDLGVLDAYADKIVARLNKVQGVTNVEKSIKPGTSKIVFIPDKAKVAQAGLTVDAIALSLRTLASGFTLDTIKLDNGDDQDIVFLYSEKTATPEEISTISIPTQTGTVYPILSLGALKLSSNPTTIVRENGKRSISVSATVTKGFNIQEINKQLETYANTELKLPPGYNWETGGVNEENQKSVNSIFQAMALSFLLILITMIIEFRSYRQAAIVMLTIPLAIPGVFYIFGLTGTPLSFPALIGVLALFGIVVTNAIVVVEKINDNRKEGMPLKESIIDASGSRLEPVMLTSITSILGLLPITIADPLWRGLGGAIIAGLLFSGIIKLFFVPLAYYIVYQKEK